VVSIGIDKNNPENINYYVGTNRVQGDSAMKAALVPFIQKDTSQQSTIVINADKAVPLESVVEVMRIARELNARTVLAVNRNAQ